MSDYNEEISSSELSFYVKRVGSIVVVIFLLQSLFKVFKFLVRIAAQYNCKADALEYQSLNNNCSLDAVDNFFCKDVTEIKDETKVSLVDKCLDLLKK